jgi:hypothetical protein
LYHLAVSVDAYVLAVPGIPLVASPRSALIIGVHVWDDALGRPLNDERRQFTVLENLSGESLLGSGLTQSAEQQLAVLSRNAAITIENWLASNPDWFPPATTSAAAEDTAPGTTPPARDPVVTPSAEAAPIAQPAAPPAAATARNAPADATDAPVTEDELLPRPRLVPSHDTSERG